MILAIAAVSLFTPLLELEIAFRWFSWPNILFLSPVPILTLLLGNLEHLINHKHQLFTYLKQMGVPVATPDLYRFRGK